MEIRVIGPGCDRCRRAADEADAAAQLAGIAANVVHVDDARALLEVNARSTPAIVVDGVLRSAGRVPSAREIASWLGSVAPPQAASPSAAAETRDSHSPADLRKWPAPAAFCGVAVTGCALALELALLHYRAHADASSASFCAIGAELDCDAVALSPSSVFMGAPIAAWGLLGYAVMAGIAATGLALRRPRTSWPAGLLSCLTAGSVAISMWLAWVSEVRVRSSCILCAACWAVNAILAVLAWRMVRRHGGLRRCLSYDLRSLLGSPVLAGAAVVGLALLALAVGTLYPAYWTAAP
jgi:uncharacterized membrane protein